MSLKGGRLRGCKGLQRRTEFHQHRVAGQYIADNSAGHRLCTQPRPGRRRGRGGHQVDQFRVSQQRRVIGVERPRGGFGVLSQQRVTQQRLQDGNPVAGDGCGQRLGVGDGQEIIDVGWRADQWNRNLARQSVGTPHGQVPECRDRAGSAAGC